MAQVGISPGDLRLLAQCQGWQSLLGLIPVIRRSLGSAKAAILVFLARSTAPCLPFEVPGRALAASVLFNGEVERSDGRNGAGSRRGLLAGLFERVERNDLW